MFKYMKTVILMSAVLLSGCVDGFEQHLKDAIELYQQRKDQYAQQTDGASDALFEKLITTETLLLPVAATFDARAIPFVKQGVMIIADDFVPMEDNLGFNYPLANAAAFDHQLQHQAKQLLKPLNDTPADDAIAISAAVNKTLLAIKDFEQQQQVYLPMTKHLVESLGFGALHSLYYRCDSNNRSYRLGQDLMLLQAMAIRLGNPLSYDIEANVFHQQGIGILVNDLPYIPFLEHYERYQREDQPRLARCLSSF